MKVVQISCQDQMVSTELIWHSTGLALIKENLSVTPEHRVVEGIPALHRSWITPWVPACCGLQSSSAWPGSVKAAQEHPEHTTVLVEPWNH